MKTNILTLTVAAAMGVALASTAQAADPADFLAEMAAQAGQPFSAERGKAIFYKDWVAERPAGQGDPETPSCTACHSDNPTNPTKHAKTGKVKDPIAPSRTPTRFTDRKTIDKWFKRNCSGVMGRECTPLEKGDFLTWMMTQ